MAQIRDMRELHPAVLPLAAEWMRRCASHQYGILIVETRRTMDVMNAYWARGRKPLDEVNGFYISAGLAPITFADNQTKITNAPPPLSSHFFGCALDFVPLVNGKPDWTYNPEDQSDMYDEIAHEATNLGMVWGGNWRTFKDRPHIEFLGGWTVQDAAQWSASHGWDWKIPIPKL